MPNTLRIAITPGEPAGIGPDLCVQLAQSSHDAELIAVADPELLMARATQLGLPLTLETLDTTAAPCPQQAGSLTVMPVPLNKAARCGHGDPANAAYVLETLRRATAATRANQCHALVTGPVHKGIINDAGIPFTGHTEFLAEQTNTAQVVMMLATAGLRVALATTHLPLQAVPAAITADHLTGVLRILDHDLRARFGIATPRILVCGLNPHAGEVGHLGREEIEVIEPVLEQLRSEQHMQLFGPLPADTLFTPRYLDHADAVLAMYHDQGLPVLKHVGFGRAVNITLGLPLIRTSVDHGTAFNLAGTGQADVGSFEVALQTALELARRSVM